MSLPSADTIQIGTREPVGVTIVEVDFGGAVRDPIIVDSGKIVAWERRFSPSKVTVSASWFSDVAFEACLIDVVIDSEQHGRLVMRNSVLDLPVDWESGSGRLTYRGSPIEHVDALAEETER